MTLPERITEKPPGLPPRYIKAPDGETPNIAKQTHFHYPRTEIKPPAIRRLTASRVIAC